MNIEWITITESCALLNVTRPTFNAYRKRYNLREVNVRNRILFSKIELIEKILIPIEIVSPESFLIFDKCEIGSLIIASNIFDLRKISNIDCYGAMSLLCVITSMTKNLDSKAYLIVNDSFSCRFLKAAGFFREVVRGRNNIYVNEEIISEITIPGMIVDLERLGYRGAEKKLLNDLYDSLMSQGFSEDICSYLGWSLGELADNAHTHTDGPCFVTINGVKSQDKNSPKFLQISIGDVGDGIQNSIRSNPKYSGLSDRDALLIAFKPNVSSWEDKAGRGKGLTDLIGIALGNKAWLRVDSNGESVYFDFRGDNIINIKSSTIPATGTIVSLVLIESGFVKTTREQVEKIIDLELAR